MKVSSRALFLSPDFNDGRTVRERHLPQADYAASGQGSSSFIPECGRDAAVPFAERLSPWARRTS